METPPYSDSLSPNAVHVDNADLRSFYSASWQALDSPSPPALREILAAYKAKGDGDREMLLAMLNAKTAEDQRIASQISLRRTMLEITRISSRAEPLSSPNLAARGAPHYAHTHPNPNGAHQYRLSPAAYTPPSQHVHLTNSSPHLSQKAVLPPMHLRSSGSGSVSSSSDVQSQTRRKRARRSRSPVAVSRHAQPPDSDAQRELPPSPYSSVRSRGRSASIDSSQGGRGAMAIGSLLTNGTSRDVDELEESWGSRCNRDEPPRGSK